MEKSVFLGGQPRPYCKGGASTSQFWGFYSIYAYTLCRRTNKFDVVTLMRKEHVVLPGYHSKGDGVLALRNFVDFYSMHTPFVAELPNLTW